MEESDAHSCSASSKASLRCSRLPGRPGETWLGLVASETELTPRSVPAPRPKRRQASVQNDQKGRDRQPGGGACVRSSAPTARRLQGLLAGSLRRGVMDLHQGAEADGTFLQPRALSAWRARPGKGSGAAAAVPGTHRPRSARAIAAQTEPTPLGGGESRSAGFQATAQGGSGGGSLLGSCRQSHGGWTGRRCWHWDGRVG
jgi:hypothetical protein